MKPYNYEIATFAEALYGELEGRESSRNAWAYSLYYVIMKSLGNKIDPLAWEENYKQWNIDHLYRGALSSKNKQLPIPVCNISRKKKKELTIIGKLTGRREHKIEVKIKKSLFIELYAPGLNHTHLFIQESEVDEILKALGEIGLKKNTTEQNNKMKTLWRLFNEIRKVYDDSGKEEKEFIETIIGAAIFYLPHPVNECFNGYCSLEALKKTLKEERIVKEHLFPRKRAGSDVLSNNYTEEDFIQKVRQEYRIFMYLTSEENKGTINYEGTHDDELTRLNIEKFPQLEENPFSKNHTFFKNFIAWAKPQVPKHNLLELSDANELLEEFLAIAPKPKKNKD